ncbi:MAG: hypothetical protein ACRECH_16670 [Nitrososphaerales archaeon]
MAKLSESTVIEQGAGTLFLHYLDEALDIYGSSVKQVVYWKFEKTHHLSRNEIYAHPEQFVETIRIIFGTGMSSIEKDMVRKIERDSGLTNLDADNLVDALRQLKSALGRRTN